MTRYHRKTDAYGDCVYKDSYGNCTCNIERDTRPVPPQNKQRPGARKRRPETVVGYYPWVDHPDDAATASVYEEIREIKRDLKKTLKVVSAIKKIVVVESARKKEHDRWYKKVGQYTHDFSYGCCTYCGRIKSGDSYSGLREGDFCVERRNKCRNR